MQDVSFFDLVLILVLVLVSTHLLLLLTVVLGTAALGGLAAGGITLLIQVPDTIDLDPGALHYQSCSTLPPTCFFRKTGWLSSMGTAQTTLQGSTLHFGLLTLVKIYCCQPDLQNFCRHSKHRSTGRRTNPLSSLVSCRCLDSGFHNSLSLCFCARSLICLVYRLLYFSFSQWAR